MGSIGLVYTAKYYPLRFHLCRMLTRLSAECGRFVPVLPHYLEVLDTHNFNKKTTKGWIYQSSLSHLKSDLDVVEPKNNSFFGSNFGRISSSICICN